MAPITDTVAFQIRLLRRLKPAARVAAIDAALAVAGPEEVHPLAVELLELASPTRRTVGRRDRRSAIALRAVIRHWERLDPESIWLARAVGRSRWLEAVGETASLDPAGRARLARLACDTADPSLGSAIVGLLADAEPDVVRHAERAVLVWATGLSPDPSIDLGAELDGPLPDVVVDPADRQPLLEALTDAAIAFPSHKRRAVLLGACILLDRAARGSLGLESTERLRAAVTDPQQPLHRAIRGVIRWSRAPVVRARAWEWLADPSMCTVAIDRVARADTTADHEAVLRRTHMVARPRRARALRTITVKAQAVVARTSTGAVRQNLLPEGSPLPGTECVRSLSLESRRGLPRFAAAMRVVGPARTLALEPLLADDDPWSRMAAARVCDDSLLIEFCFDPDPAVAGFAALAWSRPTARSEEQGVDPDRQRTLSRLARSPVPLVRNVAAQDRSTPQAWDAAHPRGRLGARRACLADEQSFVASIRSRLEAPEGRLPAISLIRALSCEARFEAELIASVTIPAQGVADCAADRITASAVAALGSVPTSAAGSVIEACRRHPDPRVRANAIEAAAHRMRRYRDRLPHGSVSAERFIDAIDDPGHRVRAGAVRAILDVGSAGSSSRATMAEPKPGPFDAVCSAALAGMLADLRAEHRLAGVWLAERALLGPARERLGRRWNDLLTRVVELGRSDADDRVRGRAARLTPRLRWSFDRAGTRTAPAVEEGALA